MIVSPRLTVPPEVSLHRSSSRSVSQKRGQFVRLLDNIVRGCKDSGAILARELPKGTLLTTSLMAIPEKTVGLIPSLRVVLAPFVDKIACAFVYGSIARREEHATSDVDLMVVGTVGLGDLAPSLRKAEKRLGREVNVTNYSVDEFRTKVAEGDHFLTTVLKGTLQFVKGEQRDLDALAGK
jgi:predicted nucleotidyltransferase